MIMYMHRVCVHPTVGLTNDSCVERLFVHMWFVQYLGVCLCGGMVLKAVQAHFGNEPVVVSKVPCVCQHHAGPGPTLSFVC